LLPHYKAIPKEQKMAIYVEYDGIKGNVTADGFKDHMNILSFQFGVGRGISMEPGKLANRESTRPSLSEITITKQTDATSTSLFKESVTGAAGKKVKIKFIRTGGDKLFEYMTYELEEVMVSGYSVSGDSEGEPVESISLSYAKLTVSYHNADKTNKGANPQRTGYDLATAKAL
jgi:type VI secretion system secreted protein Hcp